MATPKNGNVIFLRYKNSTIFTLVGQVSGGLEVSADMIDITTKDSAGAATFMAGRKSGTVSVSGTYDPAATTGTGSLDVFALLNAGTEIEAYWGEKTSATTYFTSKAFITSFSVDAEKDSVVNWSASLQLSGAITTAVGSTTAGTSTL